MNRTASIIETDRGGFSLLLNAGTTSVDKEAEALGYYPNGYFWERVAMFLTKTKARHLEGRFEYDCEAGMFCAHGSDEPALRDLEKLLNSVATNAAHLAELVRMAESSEFALDDSD